MYIHNLEERIPYTFSVRAQTIDYGPPAIGNVTTGPQPGSPGRPRDLVLSQVGIKNLNLRCPGCELETTN